MDIDPQDAFKVARSPFLIGLLGGVVALRTVPGASWGERAVNAVSASMLAGFFSPAIAEYFGLTTPAMQSATAFAVGLFGLNAVALVVAYIKSIDLSKVLPFGKKGE
ncbi:hypothetical protein [Hydrogenophaga crocea]|uniref:Holin n=1 Tax=Hydrogenophaga crocea TaxID=2716225 RepID=A0A6G8IF69_9BURK|nr:hypothetical protein [Hydrogenophaga crocea]QIM51630.1 hypothetical protein G9Q37_05490 [Hydrogenophaga crocea]